MALDLFIPPDMTWCAIRRTLHPMRRLRAASAPTSVHSHERRTGGSMLADDPTRCVNCHRCVAPVPHTERLKIVKS